MRAKVTVTFTIDWEDADHWIERMMVNIPMHAAYYGDGLRCEDVDVSVERRLTSSEP